MSEAVNTEHLMAYVDEVRGEGNQAYKAGKLSEALSAWQRGLDAIAQVIDKDGQVKLPIAKKDVEVVLRARSTLHGNRGQALMSKELWRRAIVDLSEALKVDRLNAKALWRRYRCHRALRHWAEAEADLEGLLDSELQEAAAPLLADAKMTPEKVKPMPVSRLHTFHTMRARAPQLAEFPRAAIFPRAVMTAPLQSAPSSAQLAETRAELQELRRKAEKEAEETLEERMEEAAHKGLEELRTRFEEVTARNGLRNNQELSAELAEMITRPGAQYEGRRCAVCMVPCVSAQVEGPHVPSRIAHRPTQVASHRHSSRPCTRSTRRTPVSS